MSNDYCEIEVNRLLILTAAVTRQTLDNNKRKYKETGAKKCGKFWHNYPGGVSTDLEFRKACNMIIHATDIAIKMGEYYYVEHYHVEQRKNNIKKPGKLYFRGKINIKGRGKNYAELDLEKFAQHCIVLSDRMVARG